MDDERLLLLAGVGASVLFTALTLASRAVYGALYGTTTLWFPAVLAAVSLALFVRAPPE